MKKPRLQQAFIWVEGHWPLVLTPLMAIATWLWTFALSNSFEWKNLISGFFYTLQFVVLNKEVDSVALKDANPLLLYALTVAQFAIPLIASIAFFGNLFREQITPFLKRTTVRRMDGHHVILGYGAMGVALSEELAKFSTKSRVVVVDLQASQLPDTAHITHLQQNALSPEIFELANLGKATRIYLLLPDERDNLSILATLAKSSVRADLTVFVRAESHALRRLFNDWGWLSNWLPAGRMDVRPINPYDIAARGIFNAYSPDLYAPTYRTADIAQTVMVVGVSLMAQALVLRFARMGVYSPHGNLRLIWAGKGVTEALKDLAVHYPVLLPEQHSDSHWGKPLNTSAQTLRKRLSPVAMVMLDQPAADEISDGRLTALGNEQWPAAIYVCHDSDVQNAIESRDIQAALENQVAAKESSTHLPRLILAVQNHAVIGVGQPVADSMFGYCIEEVCIDALCAQTVVQDRADDLAKKFDAVWSNKQEVQAAQWNTSHYFLKETNRDPADHAAIKLRYAGVPASKVQACVFQGSVCLDSTDTDGLKTQVGDLEAMEMRRYRAFMFLHGFSHGQASVPTSTMQKSEAKNRDRRRRVNETLLDAELSDAQKSKDNDIVTEMIRAMQMRCPDPKLPS